MVQNKKSKHQKGQQSYPVQPKPHQKGWRGAYLSPKVNDPPDLKDPSLFEVSAKHFRKKYEPIYPGAHPPWKPGQSGNPGGRPPGIRCIPDILRRIGDEPGSPRAITTLVKYFPYRAKQFRAMNNRDVVLYRAYLDAEFGDRYSRDFIVERTEGKVREYVDITTNDKDINAAPQFDLSALTPDKLTLLRGLVRDVLRKRDASKNDA